MRLSCNKPKVGRKEKNNIAVVRGYLICLQLAYYATSATAAPFYMLHSQSSGGVLAIYSLENRKIRALRSESNGVGWVRGLYAVPTGETGTGKTGRAGLGNFIGNGVMR